MLAMAIPAAISIAGGLLGGSSARKAAEAQRQAQMAYAGGLQNLGTQVQGGYNTYGDSLSGLAGQVDSRYAFTPYAARNTFGSTSFGPDGFQTSLAPGYQNLHDSMLGGANNMFGQAMAFNTQQYGQNLYDQMQGMMSRGRQNDSNQLSRMLHARGQGGLVSNVNGNGLTSALADRWGQQDQEMAFRAQSMASQEQDRALQRAYGMFGQAANVGNLGAQSFNQFTQGQQLQQPYDMAANQMYFGLNQNSSLADLQGMLANAGYQKDALAAIMGANVNSAATKNAATQGVIGGFTNALGGMNWGGMFGATPPPQPMYSSTAGPTQYAW